MLQSIISISLTAGKILREEFHKEYTGTDWKSDDSPLTQADVKSHEYIRENLFNLFPDIPLMSEEGSVKTFDERKKWQRFFCVDPMDGTREFIKKTGEFTVNIALVENGKPVLGVIYAPIPDVMYYAFNGKAFKQKGGGSIESVQVRSFSPERVALVASKDHAGPMVTALLETLPGAGLKSMGSSLKFCLVAEGEADAYLRDIPTFEWDTAAAQAIVEAAGGQVLTLDGNPLTYNKEDLRNPALITVGAGGKILLNALMA
jgi:3'(2'), 5'-bisphosphate nucleotidase